MVKVAVPKMSGVSNPSSQTGMGAIPFPGGVAFRVWAPFANGVRVAGTFNNWSTSANLLVSEGNGYWSVDVPGAVVQQEYRYVIQHDGMPPLWRIDPYARQVTSSGGNAVVPAVNLSPGDPVFQMPPWNELVLCEIHIGTFNDTFPKVPPRPGNFDTVIEKLPYLRDLGINALSVMPIMEFAGDLSWGYDPADVFAVESSYGGPDRFRALVQAAHANGIAIILDVVYNHFGPPDIDQSVWQFDGWQQGNMGGIYFYQDWRAQTPWGSENRPDYGRREVRQFIRDNALLWAEDFEVDGLRVDSTIYIRNVFGRNNSPGDDLPDGWSLLQWVNDEIKARQPWKITIAEDLQNNDWLTRATGGGGAGFGSQWDAGFVNPVRQALIVADDNSRDMGAVRNALTNRYGADAFARVIYTESHDQARQGQARVAEAIWPGNPGNYFSEKRSTLGAALVLTSPGIPMLLQGQEFLEDGYFDDGNPVDWSELDRYGGIHDLCRDLIHLRRNTFNNTRGLCSQNLNVFHVGHDDKVIAFHRWDRGGPGDDVVVLVNFRNQGYPSYTIGFPRPGIWWVRFNSDYSGYSPQFGNWPSYATTAAAASIQGMPCSGSIGVGPYSAVILSQ